MEPKEEGFEELKKKFIFYKSILDHIHNKERLFSSVKNMENFWALTLKRPLVKIAGK